MTYFVDPGGREVWGTHGLRSSETESKSLRKLAEQTRMPYEKYQRAVKKLNTVHVVHQLLPRDHIKLTHYSERCWIK
jgi:hypothetical protein